MSILKKRSTRLTISLVLIALLLIMNFAPVAIIGVEPLYTIENTDGCPHNATVKVNGYGDEYSKNITYHLEPEEYVSVEKPVFLLIKWSNPFKKGF